jgi:hypothetical protein
MNVTNSAPSVSGSTECIPTNVMLLIIVYPRLPKGRSSDKVSPAIDGRGRLTRRDGH